MTLNFYKLFKTDHYSEESFKKLLVIHRGLILPLTNGQDPVVKTATCFSMVPTHNTPRSSQSLLSLSSSFNPTYRMKPRLNFK